MPPEIMHKPQQSAVCGHPDTVLLAGRHIRLLPGQHGVVGSEAVAANGTWVAPAQPSMARRMWRAWALLWAPRHRLVAWPSAYGGHRPPQWSSTWPHADCGMGHGNVLPRGADLPADAIMDREGRILRL